MDRKIEKKRWTPGRIAILIGAVAVVVLIAVVLTRSRTSSMRTSADRLTVSTVTRGPFQELIPLNGTVMPIDNVFLDAVEGGRVEEIYLEAGSLVEVGDPILKLSNTNLLLDIMWREAELFQQSNNLRNTWILMEQTRLQLGKELADIENQLRQQRRTHERYTELSEHGLVPSHLAELVRDEYEYLVKRRDLTVESQRKDTEFRETQMAALQESLDRMGANLDVIEKKHENLTIRAPVAGQLTALTAEVGQLKALGERLGQIDILGGFKINATIDEYYINRVELGGRGVFEIDGDPYDVAVQKIYPEVTDGRFEVDLSFLGESPSGIRRGQTLRVRLQLGEMSEAVLLPRGGFFQATGGSWVYVIDGTGELAHKRRIHLGRQNPDVFEVLEGLEVGERVITSSYEGFGTTNQLVLE